MLKSFFLEILLLSKLVAYRQYVENNKFDHICWVACSKSMSIYGSKCAPTQSYWSMKYHSIIMESLINMLDWALVERLLFLMILNGIEVGHFKAYPYHQYLINY